MANRRPNNEGQCPVCLKFNLSYGVLEVQDEYVFYPYVCNNTKCNFKGREYYSLDFSSHTDSHGRDISDSEFNGGKK